jgi:hypothetical protein
MYNKCDFTFIYYMYLSQLVLVFTWKAVALNVRCDWEQFGLGNILTKYMEIMEMRILQTN